ncbi:MAG: hypothetical protein R2797_00085 [Gelidibacter sp.]
MTPPNIVSSEENIPSIEPLYQTLLKLLDDNLCLSINEIELAYLEYQDNDYGLKRSELTQEDDITTVIRRFLSDLKSVFDFEFQTKDPEKNGGSDIGVLKKFTKPRHIPLCYIEAKILPTPISSSSRQETEYVCYRDSKKQGGIERFKTGMHGRQKAASIMLAYVKTEGFTFWLNKVNSWINEEIKVSSNPTIIWHNRDLLIPEIEFNQENIAKYNSIHSRITPLSIMHITHYWLNLS